MFMCIQRRVNPLHPNISIHTFHTLFSTSPLVLIEKICFKIKASWLGDHFLFNHDYKKKQSRNCLPPVLTLYFFVFS